MIFFTAFAVISAISLQFAEETHNKPLKDEIDEIQAEKDKRKHHTEEMQKDYQESPNPDPQQDDGKRDFNLMEVLVSDGQPKYIEMVEEKGGDYDDGSDKKIKENEEESEKKINENEKYSGL